VSKRMEIEEDHPITDILCQIFHCQCESRVGKILEIIFYLVIYAAVFYWVFLPIWDFMGAVVRVLGGRG